MNRLDEVCGHDWSVSYEPWGDSRIICRLTIAGTIRSSTGETSAESEKSEIGGTVAEAQSFKRACAMFGLGRYLYNLTSVWADFDPKTKRFTGSGQAKLTQMIMQHYRRASEGDDSAERALQDIDAEDAATSVERTGDAVTSADAALLDTLNTLGSELYSDKWPSVRSRNVQRISDGTTTEVNNLDAVQLQKLIDGMQKVKAERAAAQS
jgi:hypothetical protein